MWLGVVGVLGAGAMVTFELMGRFTGRRRHVLVGIFLLGYTLCVGGAATAIALYYPWKYALDAWLNQQYDVLSRAGCDTSGLVAAHKQAITSTSSVPHISEIVFNIGGVVAGFVMMYLIYDLRRSQRAGPVEGV